MILLLLVFTNSQLLPLKPVGQIQPVTYPLGNFRSTRHSAPFLHGLEKAHTIKVKIKNLK
jgi:hypothetical protein